jgi:hypothetical protein
MACMKHFAAIVMRRVQHCFSFLWRDNLESIRFGSLAIPPNLASRRSCELAGAEFIEIVDLPPDYHGYLLGQRQKCRYRIKL